MSHVYCDQDDVAMILSADGQTARLDDDATGTLSATESGYLTRAIRWATARCNLYLLSKYAASDLANSWIVSQWCSIIAAYFVSCRRGNPSASSLKDLYEEALEDLEMIRSGEANLPDTGLRSAAWPAWSNVRVFLTGLRRVRVEQPLSETRGGKPTEYTQHVDRSADYIVDIP